jgi:hypothetical protein
MLTKIKYVLMGLALCLLPQEAAAMDVRAGHVNVPSLNDDILAVAAWLADAIPRKMKYIEPQYGPRSQAHLVMQCWLYASMIARNKNPLWVFRGSDQAEKEIFNAFYGAINNVNDILNVKAWEMKECPEDLYIFAMNSIDPASGLMEPPFDPSVSHQELNLGQKRALHYGGFITLMLATSPIEPDNTLLARNPKFKKFYLKRCSQLASSAKGYIEPKEACAQIAELDASDSWCEAPFYASRDRFSAGAGAKEGGD